jgi:hypothetical protein
LIVRDKLDDAGSVEVETRAVSRSVTIAMRAAGGFVLRLARD